jgi:hypothetical protein
VILSAGKSDWKFIVHKEFACYYSPVLKAAFKPTSSKVKYKKSNKKRRRNLTIGQFHNTLDLIFANARLVKALHCSAPSKAIIHVKVSIPITSEAEPRKHQAE